MPGKALAIPVPGPGRKSLYQEAYADQAFKLCLLGAVDEELADFFDVSIATIYNWKNEHPAFLEATVAGKIKADAEVAHSLYKSATGHQITAERVVKNGDKFEAVRYKQFIPGDPNAAYKWLVNRRRQDWADTQKIEYGITGQLADIIAARRDGDQA
jgi:transposase